MTARANIAALWVALLGAACGSAGTVPPGDLTPLPTGSDPLPSRCVATAARVDCTKQTLVLDVAGSKREVHWQVPQGAAPAGGWPAVLMFQGSLYSAEKTWAAQTTDPYGALHQTLTVKRLLDSGFAVVTPETANDGNLYWDTNQLAWASNWEAAPDAKLMTAIFDRIAQGELGGLDASRLYASGISSGGYMTSRMALSYPGRFRALAIVAASWATCGGSWCAMPPSMPADHPPTLFTHGKKDSIVPYSTMTDYEAQLRREGHETKVVSSETAGHEWLPQGPDEITAWFSTHP